MNWHVYTIQVVNHRKYSAVALSAGPQCRGLYELKTPWRNGATPVIFESLDYFFRLVLQVVLRPLLAVSSLSSFYGMTVSYAPDSRLSPDSILSNVINWKGPSGARGSLWGIILFTPCSSAPADGGTY